MKKLLGILVLSLIIFSKGYADIRDFEIEGISIGDKLDDHYSAEIQKKFKTNLKLTDKLGLVSFSDSDFEVYDGMSITFELSSKKITSISGILKVPDLKEISDAKDWMTKFDVCIAKQKNITSQLSHLTSFKPIINEEKITHGMKSKRNQLVISDEGVAAIVCVDTDGKDNDVRLYVTIDIIPKDTILSMKEKEKKIDKIIDEYTINKNSKIKFKSNDKNYALLIANSNYDYWDNLISPINDVVEIGSILKDNYGFQVEILKNGNRDNILDKLFEYSTKTSDKDNLLIYYAGHGEIVNTNAYWIPNNASKEISSKWLNINDVNSAISMINAKHLLVMVDACYQGTAFKSGSQKIIGPSNDEMNDVKYFEKIKMLRSRIVITSGNNEPVVDALLDGHSPFAYKFIDILINNNNYETSTSMFIKLNKYHANLSQSPNIIYSFKWAHGGGEFIFLKK